jgi:hypothetical protein
MSAVGGYAPAAVDRLLKVPMIDLAINLLASVIAGTAVWVLSWLRRRQRTQRMRSFFGVGPESRALFVVARHYSSPEELSVHREDAAAMVELAAMVMACGGRSDLVGFDGAPAALGAEPEFCVGGPSTNPRTAAHLRLLLPGIRFEHDDDRRRFLRIGDRPPRELPRNAGDGVVHAVVAKAYGSPAAAPVFLVCGATALSNRAAAHHLVRHHRDLARRHGTTDAFALLLSLRGLRSYGIDAMVETEDITDEAFAEPAVNPNA